MSDYVAFQVQLTRVQHRRLKGLAEARGVSMGSILRESVADYLTNAPIEGDPAFGIIGLIDDDGPTPHGDPGVEHDAYLTEALEAEADVAAPASVTGVLLDTSGIFAAASPRSDRHAEAATAYRSLLASPNRLVMTDLILAELHALSIARVHPRFGLELINRVLASSRIDIVAAGIERMASAAELLRERPDRPYSLTDAVSFGLMRELSIDRAFTLDTDFSAEGFEVVP